MKPCETDGCVYLSMPTQYKCLHCGQYWFTSGDTPICKEQNAKTRTAEELLRQQSLLDKLR